MEVLTYDVPEELLPYIRSSLSFRPYLNYLTQRSADPTDARSPLLRYIIQQFGQHPDLLSASSEISQITERKELMQLMEFSLVPAVSFNQGIAYAFGLPDRLEFFHYSPSFKKILPDHYHHDLPDLKRLDNSLRTLYQLILQRCYQAIPFRDGEVTFTFRNQQNGLTRYYRLRIYRQFIDVQFTGDLPPLQTGWIDFAEGKLLTIDQLPEPIPLDRFHAEGFAIFLIEDVTGESVLNELKEALLQLYSEPEEVVYGRFGGALKNLCGEADIEIGLMPFIQVNGRYVHHPEYSKRSIFYRYCCDSTLEIDDQRTYLQVVNALSQNTSPRIVSDLSVLGNSPFNPLLQKLYASGIRSYGVYPILGPKGIIGIMEMGSTRPGALKNALLEKLELAIPLVKEMLVFHIDTFTYTLDRKIKQTFTSLLPAVEWKFNEAAWRYIQREAQTSNTDETDIAVDFKRVNPIYGAIDIRNSSVQRNNALYHDLNNQLAAVAGLLPLLDQSDTHSETSELAHRLSHWRDVIAHGITAEEEVGLTNFIDRQLNPVLRQQAGNQPELSALTKYLTRIDSETGQFVESRKAFESSLQQINQTLGSYFEKEIKHLQAIYPHYYEKYRTDGLEYNIYIGQSFAPHLPFDLEYVNQVRFWQLSSMVSMATLTHHLSPSLPVPLQTTQLILAHSQPVDISFRRDEQRFDVEGTYSIRYEVIKKRIDKACIKGSSERLTQPDTIALVYVNSQQIDEYIPFIKQLQQQGRLRPGIEYLELDALQGVSGLKALRMGINYTL